MNYTVTISISYLLASQKILKFRISVGSSEVLVRSSDLHKMSDDLNRDYQKIR